MSLRNLNGTRLYIRVINVYNVRKEVAIRNGHEGHPLRLFYGRLSRGEVCLLRGLLLRFKGKPLFLGTLRRLPSSVLHVAKTSTISNSRGLVPNFGTFRRALVYVPSFFSCYFRLEVAFRGLLRATVFRVFSFPTRTFSLPREGTTGSTDITGLSSPSFSPWAPTILRPTTFPTPVSTTRSPAVRSFFGSV